MIFKFSIYIYNNDKKLYLVKISVEGDVCVEGSVLEEVPRPPHHAQHHHHHHKDEDEDARDADQWHHLLYHVVL